MTCNAFKKIINWYDIQFVASFGCTCKEVCVNVRQPVPVQEIWRPTLPLL
jgi:hypothetical protein